jgi:ATP-binding cassette subfamily B protein
MPAWPRGSATKDAPLTGAKKRSVSRRLFAALRGDAGPLAGTFAVTLLATPLALIVPVPLKIVVDHVLGSAPVPGWLRSVLPDAWTASSQALLWTCAIALVVGSLLVQAQGLAGWALRTWTSERLVLSWRARLFDRLQRLSLAWHDERGVADSVFRVQSDAPAVAQVVVGGWLPFAAALVRVVVVAWAVARIDLALALVALGTGPLLYLLARGFRSRLRKGWKEARERESASLAVVQESLGALRVVKSFEREEGERDRFLGKARDSLAAHMRAVATHGAFDLLSGVVVGAGAAAVLLVGAGHVASGRLLLGDLLLAATYLAQLFVPLREIGTKSADLQRALAAVDRVFAVLDEGPECVERQGLPARGRGEGRVAFEGVSFRYAARGPHAPPVLEDVTFQVAPGSRVGIEGPSGSGKTTLVSLLSRLYEPSAGRVLVDGVDVRDWRLADLRRQFAIVLQEPVLFSTSIRENVAYGRPGASQAEIEEAAKAAGVHDFVTALPDGWDTQVGERGVRLSGGERQRISLARAFLRDAPMLVLDEPTSSVDGRTEQGILDALERLMRGRTTFVIAHRLSTLSGCDVRLRVQGGHVVPVAETAGTPIS